VTLATIRSAHDLAVAADSGLISLPIVTADLELETLPVVEDGAHQTEQAARTLEPARDAFQRIGKAVEEMTTSLAQIAGRAEQIPAGACECSTATATELPSRSGQLVQRPSE
jgi:methyl-accepting chemotaxis protein